MGIFDPRRSTDFSKLKNAIDFELIRKERKIEQAMRLNSHELRASTVWCVKHVSAFIFKIFSFSVFFFSMISEALHT